jgi:hypothetical protein
MVVHPDGTYQTRTTATGRVYTGAIVRVESVAQVIEDCQDRLQLWESEEFGKQMGEGTRAEWIAWCEKRIAEHEAMLAEGRRYLYRKAEYRSDIEKARAEAAKRNGRDEDNGFPPVWDVYLVHPVPEGMKKSEHADLAKKISDEWKVPF